MSQRYFNPAASFTIASESFVPAPKVRASHASMCRDSIVLHEQVQAGVVRLVPVERSAFQMADFDTMEHVARTVFRSKRKVISNNIPFVQTACV